MTSRASRNVLTCKLLKCSQALARGLWNNGILSPYLLILTGGSKTAVGVVQGLFGLSTAALALPVGILSDKTARHIVAKLSALLDLAAISLTSAGVLASHGKYHLFCAAGIFWGLSTACDSNADALFADSVATADRSVQFTQLQALSLGCLGAGPLIAAAIFHQQGNEWTLPQLGIVMLYGMAASIAPVFFKLLVHDKYTLGTESDAYATAAPARGGSSPAAGGFGSPRRRKGAAGGSNGVSARMAARMPEDILDCKGNPAPYCQHSRDSTNGRASLPVIFSGAELRLDPSEEPGHGGGDGDGVHPKGEAGDGLHAAAGSGATKEAGRTAEAELGDAPADAEAAASPAACDSDGGGCGKVEGWLQGSHGSAANALLFLSPGDAREVEDEHVGGVTEPLLGVGVLGVGEGALRVPGADAAHEGARGVWAWWPESMMLGGRWVPYVVFAADLMSGLASGMTIKFFPIFFMEKALLSPMANSLLFACTPVGIAVAIFTAQRLAAAIGRVPAIVCLRWLGVSLLLLMAAVPRLWPVPGAIIPIYLARTAAANGTSALSRSILMDFVPKELRGRWSSLDGITMFGWSGSALLGGYLLDQHGFSAVFAATAAMQFSGSLLVMILLPVVPRHEAAAAAAATTPVAAEAAARSALRRSGSLSSGWSAAASEDHGVAVRWERTLHTQRLSIDGEEEVAQSFSSSLSGR